MAPKPTTSATRYRFGRFELHSEPAVLYCMDELVPLTPKALGILLVLARNAGEVVSRNDLIEQVWADTFVEDSNITKNISILRKMLRAEFTEKEPIRTLSRRGYQLVIPITVLEIAPPPHPVETSDLVETPDEPELPDAPGPEPLPSPPVIPVVPARTGRRWQVGALAVVLLTCAIGAWSLRHVISPAPVRRAPIAVLGFRDLSGRTETAWLGAAISEMLITELDGDDRLRTLPGESSARLRSDLSLTSQGSFSGETLERIRRASSCEYVVTGSYFPFDGKIRLDVRVQDTGSGGEALVFSYTEPENNLPELVVRTGAGIRQRFGSSPLSAGEEARRRSSMPTSAAARAAYVQGLERLRAFDAIGARPFFDQVVAREPQFPMGHLQLSRVLSLLGYDFAARKEAAQAVQLAAKLPRDEQLAVEGHSFEMAGQWERAGDIYRSLWTVFPDVPDFGLSLARTQTRNGKAAPAAETIRRLRSAADGAGDPAISLAAGAAAQARGDFPGAAAEFRAAISQARSRGTRMVEGQAQAALALALVKLPDLPGAEAAFTEAIRICSQTGDSGCVAEAWINQASQLRNAGESGHGEEAARKGLEFARKDGNQRLIGKALNLLGASLAAASRHREARDTLEECLKVAREISDVRLQAIALHRLGTIEGREGDPAEAMRYFSEEIQLVQQTDDKIGLANALEGQGRLQSRQGDFASARKNLEAALSLRRESGNLVASVATLPSLAVLARNQGDLQAARKLRMEECDFRAKHEPARLPRCQLSLADIDLLEGKFEAAEKVAAPIAATSKKLSPGGDACRILALALLGRGQNARAREAVVKAQAFATTTDDMVAYGIPATIAAGRVESASGNHRAAMTLLKRALHDAEKADVLALQYDARLALGQAGMRSGDRRAAPDLETLQDEANRRGYLLIASRARQALAEPRH